MSYEVAYSDRALRQLRRIDAATARRVQAKIRQVAENPLADNANVVRLTHLRGYRLRVGGWRATFELDHAAKRLVVANVEARGGAYKGRRK